MMINPEGYYEDHLDGKSKLWSSA